MILSADFGGTTIKLGLVHGGSVIARNRLEACADQSMSDRLDAVRAAWELLLNENSYGLSDCRGAALALPFLADINQPRVQGKFGKFSGAEEIDFGVWSRTRLGLPVVLENDLRVALLGEWAAGAALGRSDAVMIALGTGIGCAAISGGRLLRGANNRAATLFGHSTVAHKGACGRCGNVGCAEDLASTATLDALARTHPDFPDSRLAHSANIDYETIFELSAQGDPCAHALVNESLHVWAVLVENAILAYDPEVIVLGGGILRSRDIVLPPIRQHLQTHMPGLPLNTPIVAAALGDDAALIGGEVLFEQNQPPICP